VTARLYWRKARYVSILTFAFLILAARIDSQPTPGSSPGWFDIRDFGAVCDGKTDDTSAILAASKAVAASGGAVFFSPGNNSTTCEIDTPMTMPQSTSGQWVVWAIANPLQINATVTTATSVAFIGLPSFVLEAPQFVTQPYASVYANANPAFYVYDTSNILFKNLFVQSEGPGINILVDGGSTGVTFDHVWSVVEPGNTAGSPLVVRGGFGYVFSGGGFESSAGGQPAMLFEVNTNNSAPAMASWITVRDTFFSGQGIKVYVDGTASSGCGSLLVEDVLYESGTAPFLTINDGGQNFYCSGFELRKVSISDYAGKPNDPIVLLQATNVHWLTLDSVWGEQTQPLIGGDVASEVSQAPGMPLVVDHQDLQNAPFQGGSWPNGSLFFCPDCQVSSGCSSGGNGAMATKLNGSFSCN